MTREWNAKVYDELPLPHVAWGKRTIERLHLAGTERVLDAGCGTGRDAEELLRRFPDVELVGIDYREPSKETGAAQAEAWGFTWPSIFDKTGTSAIEMQGVLASQPSTAILEDRKSVV